MGHHLAVIKDKQTIKISEPQETLQMLAALRHRPVSHPQHLQELQVDEYKVVQCVTEDVVEQVLEHS